MTKWPSGDLGMAARTAVTCSGSTPWLGAAVERRESVTGAADGMRSSATKSCLVTRAKNDLAGPARGESGGRAGRATRDLVGPHLAVHAHRAGRLAAAALGGRAVPVGEGGRAHPGVERVLVP